VIGCWYQGEGGAYNWDLKHNELNTQLYIYTVHNDTVDKQYISMYVFKKLIL